MFLAGFNSSFGRINFLPSEASSTFVFFPCHLTLLALGVQLPFFPLIPREDSCSANPAFCLTWLTSNTWEFPVPVPVRGDVWKVTSTCKNIFPRGLYLLTPWETWSLLSSRVEVLLTVFLLSTEILNLIALWSLCPGWPPFSTLLMRSPLLTSSRSSQD